MNETEILLTHVRQCRQVDLYTFPSELTPDQNEQFQKMKARREAGEPLQYIVGETDFMGIPLKVDPRVLIPRPETELLVEKALEVCRVMGREDLSILDVGTGSGNIPLAMATFLPAARIVSVDVSPDALALARENAKALGLEDRVRFICQDMRDFFKETGGGYDILISNPPYVPAGMLPGLPADVQREPRLALDGGADGLDFYRSIIPAAGRGVKSGGVLLLEIGDGQKDSLRKIFEQDLSFDEAVFYNDYVGTPRIVSARRRS